MRSAFTFLFLFLSNWLAAQSNSPAVTTQPTFPTADAPVTIIVDLTKATDSRAKGLLGKTDDVYLWSGAGQTATGNAFEFQPAGQTNFNAPFAPGKMTSLGNDRWQITLTPRTYYNVPAGTPIRRLGLVIKNGAGSAQTEDLYALIYDNRLTVAFLSPADQSLLVDANATIPVRARVSKPANLTLTLDGQPLASAQNVDSLVTTVPTGAQTGVRRTVILTAQTGSETAADTFSFLTRPVPTVAELPANVRDGINYTGATTATLVLFAPLKSFVYVLGEFNNWTPSAQYLMNRTPDGNRYWLNLTGLPAGQEVAFQYLVDGTIGIGDPYCDKILDRNNDQYIAATTYPNLKPFPTAAVGNTVSVLQTNQTPYAWQVNNFQRPPAANMVVYELLVRDFSASRTYRAVQDSLGYLKRLGVNVIELMPIAEFTGNDSWGYNPIFYCAPDKAYGTKDDLKRLIDAAHQQGIAVVLDMVFNQADYEFPYVKLYWAGDRPAANSPFFNQQATHPYSVFFDFNHESPATQAYVQRVNQYWLQEYRFDGYRFDLAKGFTQKNTGSDVAAWGQYDSSRVAIWKRYNGQIRQYDPSAYVILEHFAVDAEQRDLAAAGMLLWDNQNGNYRAAARGANADLSSVSYKNRGYAGPNLINYIESHDEERLLYDLLQNGNTGGSYNIRSLPTALDRAKLAGAFLFSVPGPKLLWQFGELGYDLSINTCSDGTTVNDGCRTAAKPVRWNYYQDANRQRLYKTYSALINLKTTVPAFATSDFTTDFANVVKRLTLRSTSGTAFLIGNFDVQPQTVTLGLPTGGTWYHYFSGQALTITDPNVPVTLEPGAFHLYTTNQLPKPEAGLVPFAVVPSPVTAIDPAVTDRLTVSPNPADGPLNIELTGTYRGTVGLTLTDEAGRTVRATQVTKATDRLRLTFDIGDWRSGLYMLRVQQGDRQTVRKVLKQ